MDSLDPFGEKNALRELGLTKGVSQEEIKAKYRELSKVNFRASLVYKSSHLCLQVHHPDKVKGSPEEKEAAQAKFVAIQQAYEKLSTLKKQRARANKKSEKEEKEEQSEGSKVEL